MNSIETDLQDIILNEKRKTEIQLLISNHIWYSTSHLYDEETYCEMFERLNENEIIEFVISYQEQPYSNLNKFDKPYSREEIINAWFDLKLKYSEMKYNEYNDENGCL